MEPSLRQRRRQQQEQLWYDKVDVQLLLQAKGASSRQVATVLLIYHQLLLLVLQLHSELHQAELLLHSAQSPWNQPLGDQLPPLMLTSEEELGHRCCRFGCSSGLQGDLQLLLAQLLLWWMSLWAEEATSSAHGALDLHPHRECCAPRLRLAAAAAVAASVAAAAAAVAVLVQTPAAVARAGDDAEVETIVVVVVGLRMAGARTEDVVAVVAVVAGAAVVPVAVVAVVAVAVVAVAAAAVVAVVAVAVVAVVVESVAVVVVVVAVVAVAAVVVVAESVAVGIGPTPSTAAGFPCEGRRFEPAGGERRLCQGNASAKEARLFREGLKQSRSAFSSSSISLVTS